MSLLGGTPPPLLFLDLLLKFLDSLVSPVPCSAARAIS